MFLYIHSNCHNYNQQKLPFVFAKHLRKSQVVRDIKLLHVSIWTKKSKQFSNRGCRNIY